MSTSTVPSPKLVLLVEQGVTRHTGAADCLRDEDFVVIEADGAAVALRVLGYLSASVHVVVADMQSHDGRGGADFVRQVRDSWPEIGTVLMTASTPADRPARSRFVVRPYAASDLVTQVRYLADNIPVLMRDGSGVPVGAAPAA